MANLYVNGTLIEGVDLSAELESTPMYYHDGLSIKASTSGITDYKLTLKPRNSTNLVFGPLVAKPVQPDEYHQHVLQNHLDFLIKQVPFHISGATGWITDQDDYDEEPSFEHMKQMGLQLKYRGRTAMCGQVHKLIWMNQAELSKTLKEQAKIIDNKIMAEERAAIDLKIAKEKKILEEKALAAKKFEEEQIARAKKAREADPLYPWSQRMTQFGYYGLWKVKQATLKAPAGVQSGDMMVYVTFEKLSREDKDVFIGVLHELIDLSDNDLRLAIDNAYQKASGSYVTCRPGWSVRGKSGTAITFDYTSVFAPGSGSKW